MIGIFINLNSDIVTIGGYTMESNSEVIYKQITKQYNFVIADNIENSLRNVLRFLSVSSISVGVSAFFATYIMFILLGITPSVYICLTPSLMAFSVYSLNKLTDLKEDSINTPDRLNFLKGRKYLIISYSILAYLLSIYLAFLDKPSSAAIVLFPLIANALYGSRVLPGLPRLKDIPVMKNIVVASCCAVTTTFLPAAHMMDASLAIAIAFCFMFGKAFINTLLYDVRDIKGDGEKGVKTIPVLVGKKRTVYLLLIMNSILLLLAQVFIWGNAKLLATSLVLYGYFYILYFTKTMQPLAMDLLIDGEWMNFSIVLLLLKGCGFMA